MHDLAVSLTIEAQNHLALWALKMLIILEATIRGREHQLYTKSECEQLRVHSIPPDRTLIWLGRIAECGLFANGTHIWLSNNRTELFDGQAPIFTIGHVVLQV